MDYYAFYLNLHYGASDYPFDLHGRDDDDYCHGLDLSYYVLYV